MERERERERRGEGGWVGRIRRMKRRTHLSRRHTDRKRQRERERGRYWGEMALPRVTSWTRPIASEIFTMGSLERVSKGQEDDEA